MTEDAKRYAEATFMKKKMYYNMRIKTIKRTFSAIIQICKKATLIRKDMIYQHMALQNKALSSFQVYEDLNKDQDDQLQFIKAKIVQLYSQIDRIDDIFEIQQKQLYDQQQKEINQLIVELETGGNIRFQEGNGTEKWYTSCIDLIDSRFKA